MCEHHHAAKHILCSQCDMLVALPRLEHGQNLLDQMEQQNGAKNKNEHQDNGCHHCHLLDC